MTNNGTLKCAGEDYETDSLADLSEHRARMHPSGTAGHLATRRPLVLVDISGGCVQATFEYPGDGAPIVDVVDFDTDDIDDDYREHLAERAEEWADWIRARSDHPDDLAAAARYASDAAEWRTDLVESRAEAARALATIRPDRHPARLARCHCRPSHIEPTECPSYGPAAAPVDVS